MLFCNTGILFGRFFAYLQKRLQFYDILWAKRNHYSVTYCRIFSISMEAVALEIDHIKTFF